MSDSRSIYLGDQAYANLDEHGDLRLTTGSHRTDEATNIIYLGLLEQDKLLAFLREAQKEKAEMT